MYLISANLVHRELRNAAFEGKKIVTSIKRPDSADDGTFISVSPTQVHEQMGHPVDERFNCTSLVCKHNTHLIGHSKHELFMTLNYVAPYEISLSAFRK